MKKQKSATSTKKIQSISFSELFSTDWSIPLILLFLLVIIFSIRLVSSFDIGFHLAGGRWILENFAFPSKDVFTYTVNNNDYIDIQWLFQVLNYIIFAISGYAGLTILNAFLMALLFFLMLKRLMNAGVSVWITVLSLFLVLIAIQVRISTRPEVFTWIGIVLILLILDKYLFGRKKTLFVLPLIMLLWVNLHGLFVIGLFIIGVYFVSIWLKEKKIDKYFLKWFAIAIAATLINPYFLEGALFPFYLFTRLQSSNIFKNSITELQSPFSVTDNLGLELFLYIAIAVTSLILILLTYKMRSIHEFILLAAFFYISVSAYRNVPIFIFYAVYIIAISFNDIVRQSKFLKLFEKQNLVLRYLPYIVSVIFVLTGLRVVTNAYYVSYGSAISFGAGLNKNTLPEDAGSYLITNHKNERMLNQLDAGGWLIWQVKEPVFIDGRLEVMKEDFYKEYNKSFQPNGLAQLIGKYKAESIIFNHATAYVWGDELNKLSNWKPVYFDGNFAVYSDKNSNDGFKDSYNEFIRKNNLDTVVQDENLTQIIESSKTGFSGWLSGFYTKQDHHSELLNGANFALQNNMLNEAKVLYLNYLLKTMDGFNKNFHMDAFANLGEIYLAQNDLSKALICFENYRSIDPNNSSVLNKIAAIKIKMGSKN